MSETCRRAEAERCPVSRDGRKVSETAERERERETHCDDHVGSSDALQRFCEFRLAETVEARGGEGRAGADEVEGQVAQCGEDVRGVDCCGRGEQDWRGVTHILERGQSLEQPTSFEEEGT